MSRLKDIANSIREKKEVQEGKQIDLEKDDYKALVRAAYMTFGPIALACVLFFALVIFLFVFLWGI